MKNKFFASDHHLGHENIWAKFKNSDDSPLRSFSSTEEMNEHIIQQHNSVVGQYDTVYFCGDFVINQKFLPLLKRFNGKIKLIMGNHDIFGYKKYIEAGFYEVVSYRVFVDNFILSHIPLHPDSISQRFVANVHGHLHGNRVLLPDGSVDPRYFSICMEKLDNYTPISFDDLNIAIKKQMDEAGYERPKNTQGNWSAD